MKMNDGGMISMWGVIPLSTGGKGDPADHAVGVDGKRYSLQCIDRVYEAIGECLPLGTTVYTADHAVGVDVGDLCAELDQRIGDPIERAVGRYLDKAITRHIRENVVRDLAEKIITYDRVVKESNAQV